MKLLLKSQHDHLLRNGRTNGNRVLAGEDTLDFPPVVKLFTPDAACRCRIIDYAASGSSTNPRQCDRHRKLSMFARIVVISPATLAGASPRSEA